MDFLRFIVFDILGVTPLLVGFIALIGLLIQRKPIEKVLSGTFKTIVGFLVFAGGAGIAVTSLGNFQTLFSDGFGLKGVMPLAEALTGLAQTKFAMCVSLIMVIGFGWNLFFARVTPFKYIFLTGQHNLYLSALLTVTLKALGYSDREVGRLYLDNYLWLVAASVTVAVPALTPPGTKTLLDGVSIDLAEHRIALIGANGSGKSTLLRLLNGLIVPTQGRVDVEGHDTRRDAAAVRRLVGFTFTDPLSQLVLPTPLDDVELSLRSRVRDREARQAQARAWLARYGLADVAERSIYDLSGGERQLAALVSVLAVQPSVLVCDEPTTLLDLRNRNLVAQVLADLPHQVIIATHDLELAAQSERVIVIDAGRVVADGDPETAIAAYRALLA